MHLHKKKQRGLYQNKVNSSLAAIQRPGHLADNCKMVCCGKRLKYKATFAFSMKIVWLLRSGEISLQVKLLNF